MSDFEIDYCEIYRSLPSNMAADLERRGAFGGECPIPFKLDTAEDTDAFVDAAEKTLMPYWGLRFSSLNSGELELAAMGWREFLRLDCLYLSRYCLKSDCNFGGFAILLSMERSGASRPIDKLFRQISTGMELVKNGSEWQWAPYLVARSTDGLCPYKQVKPDGSRGLTSQNEPALAAWESYNASKRLFEAEYPNRDYSVLLKRALLPLCPMGERGEVFSPDEAQRSELLDRVAELYRAYEYLAAYPSDEQPFDLLDVLVNESMLEGAQDEHRRIEDREDCVRRLTASIERSFERLRSGA